MTNCPNCGAPITSAQCEYCGTVHSTVMRAYRNYAAYEKLKCETELLKLKIKNLNDQRIIRDLYEDTLRAMRSYTG